MSGKLTTKEFIERAREAHGNRYDYSLVQYKNIETKVKIICSIHGEFEQRPNGHLVGKGCQKCGEKSTLTTEKFIEKAREVHGETYDYSSAKYVDYKTKIEIICFKHGSFFQNLYNHLYGQGCFKCAKILISDKNKLTTEEFVERVKKIHNNFYDYSLVEYKKSNIKVKIICPEHGIFEQRPNDHLNEQNCPECAKRNNVSKLETQWLDYLNIPQKYRQQNIVINNKSITPDAFNPEINTIWEFHGDYWHGNPDIFDANDFNKHNKKTYGELYQETMDRIKLFEKNGYKVIYIWESDFKKLLKIKK